MTVPFLIRHKLNHFVPIIIFPAIFGSYFAQVFPDWLDEEYELACTLSKG